MQWCILPFISIIWLLQLHSCTFLCGPKQEKCVGTLVPLNLQLILITKTQNRMQRRDLYVRTSFWPLHTRMALYTYPKTEHR